MPPATTISLSPARISCAASVTARKPDPHALLIVNAGTPIGSLASTAATRAGLSPVPAAMTLPMTTSSTCSLSMPARLTASAITAAPNVCTDTSARPPPNLPMGVRTALTITTCSTLRPPYGRHACPGFPAKVASKCYLHICDARLSSAVQLGFLQEVAGDDEALDFRGAFVDGGNTGVAVEPLHLGLADVAVAAKDLDGAVGDEDGAF